MTRKDYVRLAAALHSSMPRNVMGNGIVSYEQWQKDVAAVTNALADENQRFDSGRFMNACIGATS